MPISDTDDYPSGHFNRVYLHLLRPAIEKAGFEATRADEIQETNFYSIRYSSASFEC